MKAKLKPLVGKYYGTEVLIEDEGVEQSVTIWLRGNTPSDRELEPHTRADWDANIEIDNGWGSKSPIQSEGVDWSHFESEQSLTFATRLVDAINRGVL